MLYLKTPTTEVFRRESKNHGRISPNKNHVTGTGSEMPGIQHWKRRNKIMSEFDHQHISASYLSIKNWMGPYQRTPFSKLRSSVFWYSGFFGVRETWVLSVGSDFLEFMYLTTWHNSKVVSTHRTGTHPEQPLPTGYKGNLFDNLLIQWHRSSPSVENRHRESDQVENLRRGWETRRCVLAAVFQICKPGKTIVCFHQKDWYFFIYLLYSYILYKHIYICTHIECIYICILIDETYISRQRMHIPVMGAWLQHNSKSRHDS